MEIYQDKTKGIMPRDVSKSAKSNYSKGDKLSETRKELKEITKTLISHTFYFFL